MKISSLHFHFEKPPIFTARRYGETQWIEARDADARYDKFDIFIDGDRSFEALTAIVAAMNAAWSDAGDHVVAAEQEG